MKQFDEYMEDLNGRPVTVARIGWCVFDPSTDEGSFRFRAMLIPHDRTLAEIGLWPWIGSREGGSRVLWITVEAQRNFFFSTEFVFKAWFEPSSGTVRVQRCRRQSGKQQWHERMLDRCMEDALASYMNQELVPVEPVQVMPPNEQPQGSEEGETSVPPTDVPPTDEEQQQSRSRDRFGMIEI